MLNIFSNKFKEVFKISFNCHKELINKIDEMCDFYFCSRTALIIEAINYFYKSYKRKVDRLDKMENIKKREPK